MDGCRHRVSARELIIRTCALLSIAAFSGCARERQSVIVACGTTVESSGLLAPLSTAFEHDTSIEIHPIAVGTGKALRLLGDGQADMSITHDAVAESTYIKSHRVRLYRPFMWNEFVLVGPAADPAGVRGSQTVQEAFARIASAYARFASRNDESGTHMRELAVWSRCRLDPHANPNYLPLGQPMAALLRSASELGAYALADRATFDQLSRSLQLTIVFSGDPFLRNVYAIALPPARGTPGSRNADRLTRWLLSSEGRRVIEGYRIAGQQQFHCIP